MKATMLAATLAAALLGTCIVADLAHAQDPFSVSGPGNSFGAPGKYGNMHIGGYTSARKRKQAERPVAVKAYRSKAECERQNPGVWCHPK